MANCDICNAALGRDEGTAYSLEDLQDLLGRGFGPPDGIIRRALAAGWTREQVLARWRQGLDARPQPYWMLCASCAERARAFFQPALPLEAAAEAPPVPAEAAPPEPAPPAEAPPPAEPAAPEEGSEEIPAEAPAGARPKARPGWAFLIGLLIGLIGGLLLGAFVLAQYVQPPPPTPQPAPTEISPTPSPTRPFPTRRPATARPTEFLVPPTAIPVGNLSAAVLAIGDLARGAQALTSAELAELGITQEALTGDLPYAQARVRNVVAFKYTRPDELVLSFLLYPLTPEEAAAFDGHLSPAKGLELVAGLLSRQEFAAPALREGELSMGDKSIAITVLGAGDTEDMRTDIAIVRRDKVVEVVLIRHLDGRAPRKPLEDLVLILDERVARVVEMP